MKTAVSKLSSAKGRLRRRLDDRARSAPDAASFWPQLAQHVRVGLDQDQLGHRRRIELEVDAGAGAELELLSARRGEQLAAHLPQAGLLGRLEAAVVDGGEDPPPGRVVDPSHQASLFGGRRSAGLS